MLETWKYQSSASFLVLLVLVRRGSQARLHEGTTGHQKRCLQRPPADQQHLLMKSEFFSLNFGSVWKQQMYCASVFPAWKPCSRSEMQLYEGKFYG